MTVARPRRADVARAYDLGVDAYDALWSPVILPPAVAVAEALALAPDARVVDVGAGSGALLPALRRCAPDSAVVSVDASEEMLRAARRNHAALAVRADALALPVADGSVDAVLLAFVLFHLAEPATGLAEAARALRRGGRVGTVTWTREGSAPANKVFEAALADAGAPVPPVRRIDQGLDSEVAIRATLGEAGFSVDEVWLVGLRHRWEPDAYWALATGNGVNRARLAALDDATREETLATAQDRVMSLDPEAFSWWGEVVCAVASKRWGP